jgi:hypothetical protein
MIRTCTCKHSSQDELHGEGNRVHTTSTVGKPESRCTACGSVKMRDMSPSKPTA